MTRPTFCSKCGNQLGSEDQFCGRCGEPIPTTAASAPPVSGGPPPPNTAPPPPYAPQQPYAHARPVSQAPQPVAQQPPYQAPYQSPAEPGIIEIIDSVQQSSGFLGMKKLSYNMIIFPDRLVFALVSKDRMTQATNQARQQAKAEGKGFFGQWGAQMSWVGLIVESYYGKGQAQIMRENPGSFALENAHIQRIRFRHNTDPDNNSSERQMIIQTGGGKYRFVLLTKSTGQVKRALSQTLGGVTR